MVQSEQEKEVLGYVRICVYGALVILSVLIALAMWAYVRKLPWFLPVLGGLSGTLAASINLLAIAWAFHALVIKKARKIAILVPVLTFLGLCIMAYVYAVVEPEQALGFALGLTVPAVLGGAIVFSSTNAL